MFEQFLTRVSALFDAIPFTAATWAVIGTLALFIWLFSKASRDPKNPIKWEHLLIDSSNDRASPYKVGFVLGALVGTWIVVKLADADKLTYDIFGMYLTYLLGGSSINTFVKARGAERRRDAEYGGYNQSYPPYGSSDDFRSPQSEPQSLAQRLPPGLDDRQP